MAKDTIKIVYDYYGPEFPISNTTKNVGSVVNHFVEQPHSLYYDLTPTEIYHIFNRHNKYELIPKFCLKENDTFIYDYTLVPTADFWKTDFNYKCKIDETILSKIRQGKGYLLLSLVNEAYVEFNHFEIIYKFLYKNKIPLHKTIYMTGCNNTTEAYNGFCYNKDPIPGRIHVTSCDWFELKSSLDVNHYTCLDDLNNFKKIEKDFLCYNYKYKPHRAMLLAAFYKKKLLENSYFSFMKNEVDFKSYYNTKVNSKFTEKIGITNDDLMSINEKLPYEIDGTVTESEKVRLFTKENLYEKSLISVVTESIYFNLDVFFTEKTFKPIANKHPFIIVSVPNFLVHLKRKGYKTFNYFFDESYDSIDNHEDRMLKIIEVCQTINNWNPQQKEDFFNQTKEITDYNYNLLLSRNKVESLTFWEDFYNTKK